MQDNNVRETIRDGYARIAESGQLTTATAPDGGGCCGPATSGDSSCCGGGNWSAEQLATQIGYDAAQIAALPQGANMGLSCGNPTAIANLQPGQVVVDLGSGGGFDVFLAGPKVGPSGRVIGVDMTPQMISKARGNVASYRASTGLDNVEFRLGEIEHLPLADGSVDVVISNCVINLSTDKAQVWREVGRVLKPGGTVAVSDMALLQPLPTAVTEAVEAMIGCVAGAVLVDAYRQMVEAAGFREVVLRTKPEYVAALCGFKDPLYAKISESLPAGRTIGDYVTSLAVSAVR